MAFVPGASVPSPRDRIGSRVFVIFGGPGEGKSALFAHVCNKFAADVVAVHACNFSIQDTTNPRRIVLWIVYQVTFVSICEKAHLDSRASISAALSTICVIFFS